VQCRLRCARSKRSPEPSRIPFGSFSPTSLSCTLFQSVSDVVSSSHLKRRNHCQRRSLAMQRILGTILYAIPNQIKPGRRLLAMRDDRQQMFATTSTLPPPSLTLVEAVAVREHDDIALASISSSSCWKLVEQGLVATDSHSGCS